MKTHIAKATQCKRNRRKRSPVPWLRFYLIYFNAPKIYLKGSSL